MPCPRAHCGELFCYIPPTNCGSAATKRGHFAVDTGGPNGHPQLAFAQSARWLLLLPDVLVRDAAEEGNALLLE